MIRALQEFTFDVDPSLEAKVFHGIERRMRQVQRAPLNRRQLLQVCCFALVFLLLGSVLDLGTARLLEPLVPAWRGHLQENLGPMGLYWTAALVIGALSGLWLLAIGYVFGDARLRGMRAALWTAVVILLPHLLGFLLYFVLRSPVLSACARCGMAISSDVDFCSFCGSQQRKGAMTQSSPSPTSGIGDLL